MSHFHTHFRIMTVGVYILLPCMLVSWALADLMFQFSSTIVIAALFLVTTPVQVSTLHTYIDAYSYVPTVHRRHSTYLHMYVCTYVRCWVHTHTHIIRTYISVCTHTHTRVHIHVCMYVWIDCVCLCVPSLLAGICPCCGVHLQKQRELIVLKCEIAYKL